MIDSSLVTALLSISILFVLFTNTERRVERIPLALVILALVCVLISGLILSTTTHLVISVGAFVLTIGAFLVVVHDRLRHMNIYPST